MGEGDAGKDRTGVGWVYAGVQESVDRVVTAEDEEGVKEAALLTAQERRALPFHGAPLITCHNWRPDSQESSVPFPTWPALCIVMKMERRDSLAGIQVVSGTVKLSQNQVKRRRLAE